MHQNAGRHFVAFSDLEINSRKDQRVSSGNTFITDAKKHQTKRKEALHE